MFRPVIVATICAALVSSACAVRSLTPAPLLAVGLSAAPQDAGTRRALMADYVQRLAAGSRVRIERADGSVLRGTLMNAGSETIVVQEHTRVPEPPLTLLIADLARVTLDGPPSVGRTVGIGVLSGAGAALGVFFILVALLSD